MPHELVGMSPFEPGPTYIQHSFAFFQALLDDGSPQFGIPDLYAWRECLRCNDIPWRRLSLSWPPLALPLLPTARSDDKPRYSGPTDKGFLLPNGWTLTPAGEQVALTDLPLNIIPLADGRHALTATSGFNTHNLSLIDLVDQSGHRQCECPPELVWPRAGREGGQDLWSGAGSDLIHTFDLKGKTLVATGKPDPNPASRKAQPRPIRDQAFPERPDSR